MLVKDVLVVMRRVLLFVGAFGVLLVHCGCLLVTLLYLRGYLVVAFILKFAVLIPFLYIT
jgi:hypothetical protein